MRKDIELPENIQFCDETIILRETAGRQIPYAGDETNR
jgi:hypothetical protein